MNTKSFIKRIKRTGLSQAEFARRCGFHDAHLSRVLSGKIRNPRIDTFERIEKMLKKLERTSEERK